MRWIACLASLTFLGCGASAAPGGTTPTTAPAPRSPSEAPAQRIQLHASAQRPPLSLVAREGDPTGAVAVAVSHDLGSTASLALATVTQKRLHAAGFVDVSMQAHDRGYQLQGAVSRPGKVSPLVQALVNALLSPITPAEARAAAPALQRLPRFTSGGHAALASCSGELGVLDAVPAPNAEKLESWRQQVHHTKAVAFAALGSPELLTAAAKALDQAPKWPTGSPPADVWPTRDVAWADQEPGPTRASVALRLPDPGASAAAARRLAAWDANLSGRLAFLEPSWRITSVVATARPRGGCLRVDLETPGDATSAGLARALLATKQQMLEAQADAAAAGWSLDDNVLAPADPRDAATIAAWQTLSRLHQAGAARHVLHASLPTPIDQAELDSALALAQQRLASPALETVSKVEPGQGQLRLLIANTCGTLREGSDDAGLTALVVHTLARTELPRVRLRPWITADGVGLLAEGPRAGPDETPRQHSVRVASALGRALVGGPLGGADIAAARVELQTSVDDGPQPGWLQALQAVAPPSWLVPLGTWEALQGTDPQDVTTWRRRFLQGPLRLAVLANSSREQVEAASETLGSWLWPHVDPDASCPKATLPTPKPGEYHVETASDTELRADVTILVPLLIGAGTPQEAAYTEYLLGREGGWLDQALVRSGLAASARVHLLGGRSASALAIELSADSKQVGAAADQARALLQRLAQGSVTRGEHALAKKAFAEIERAQALSPNHRLIATWRKLRPSAPPTLASLRQFHQLTLDPKRHIVVRARRRGGKKR